MNIYIDNNRCLKFKELHIPESYSSTTSREISRMTKIFLYISIGWIASDLIPTISLNVSIASNIVMRWAQLKYPLMAGLGVSIAVDFSFRFYEAPPESHWSIWLDQINKISIISDGLWVKTFLPCPLVHLLSANEKKSKKLYR